jgi:DNA (cytosine-5)-methyltransferase 1
MRYGSVCSGIEAASVAWEPLGWKPAWFSEIEAFPCSVLAHRWPHVANLGDMTALAGYVRAGAIEAPDVLVGGTPCQAFSVAGLRNSLQDARGQLSLSFIDLANAIDEQRIGNESIVIWENVPGVLNTSDNAFGCFLGALAGSSGELQPPRRKWGNAGHIVGPQRNVTWRVLDAQYFGVAQRRRRVFVVASARRWIDTSQILLEFDGVRRNSAPRRETRQETARTTESCVGTSVPVGFRMRAFGEYADDDTASTMKARDYKDATDLVLTPALDTLPIFGIPGNWIGRAPQNGGNAVEPMLNVSPCQTATDRHAVAYATTVLAFAQNSRDEVRLIGGDGQISGALAAQPGMKQTTYISFTDTLAVRRLTPTECERLQGFPDGHTAVPHRGKPAADGPRYKALGNSMAVPCMRFIGERIQRMLD